MRNSCGFTAAMSFIVDSIANVSIRYNKDLNLLFNFLRTCKL